MALAKARLAVLAHEAELAPGVADRIAVWVRTRPWRGVGIALGVGLALGLSRGRGARVVGALVGPLGVALATGVVRQFVLGTPTAASALEVKLAEVRSRTAAR